MFTITIIFALLVALWGFCGAITSAAKRALDSAKRHAPAREPTPQARGSRPVASA